MKIFKKDLVLTKDTVFNDDIKVNGNIICKGGSWNITARDITARDITAGNIDARDIDARNINARNIDALDIDARDINARDIICEKRIKKSPSAKTIARTFIQNRSKLERKEWLK